MMMDDRKIAKINPRCYNKIIVMIKHHKSLENAQIYKTYI